jgi:hypothetical protein
MSTYLEWGNLAWPYRRIINMVGSDADGLNWQMECGHVAWMRGLVTLTRMEGSKVLRQWNRGDQDIFTRCRGCGVGLSATHPLGVPLPLRLDSQPGEVHITQADIDRANRKH